jgi:hypothetical protein
MSSPRITVKAKVKAPTRTTKEPQGRTVVVRPSAKQLKQLAVGESAASAETKRLAAAIERELKAGRVDMLSPQALQSLMAALCNTYAAQIEAGGRFTPVPEGSAVSPTAVMVTASGLLRAANLAVFELGMWQSWTGR